MAGENLESLTVLIGLFLYDKIRSTEKSTPLSVKYEAIMTE
jgi:hypothetical protein